MRIAVASSHSTASTKLPITPKAANALSLLTRENEDWDFRQLSLFSNLKYLFSIVFFVGLFLQSITYLIISLNLSLTFKHDA